MKTLEPATRILGARRKEVSNPAYKAAEATGMSVIGIPETIMVWDKPPHNAVADHFVNAAAKRMFLAGEIEAKDAFTRVKVYDGMDNKTYRALQQSIKYGRKLSSEEWKAEAARRKAA